MIGSANADGLLPGINIKQVESEEKSYRVLTRSSSLHDPVNTLQSVDSCSPAIETAVEPEHVGEEPD